ncbi:RNA polymerase recycling motor HelD [Agrilactobacillus yilanensis]|uniref:RNA polymerase recycling motor HelD n=1 Tax=Agrilactobacillus yilanensis TaxID=2485997 RepID=A0ABW4J7N2_9LACO|nr:RNA polymerase recycling motor HelD [Agrilactobacillus yilanensis]
MDENNQAQQVKEQRHLNEVVAQLDQRYQTLDQKIKQTQAEEQAINKTFFDDVKLSYGSDTTNLETALSIRQQQQLLLERNNSWQSADQEQQTVARLQKNPYFARVDFHEHGEPKKEKIYIGLSSFSDEQGKFLIYDWRAPISSIYYEGKLGAVTYKTPDGVQSVDLSLKRQFLIKDDVIQSMFDTTETIGDQMLLEVLGEKSTPQMKSIVTTIQKEQNQLIRDTDSELLFVQGAAGSGKTSAVLQRIAFLLYQYRGSLNASQVIMFSPNQLFNDYVENVLPELGEQNMVQLTYSQFAGRRVPKLTVQSLSEQFESETTPDQKNSQRLKASLAFFKALETYGHHLEKADMRFKDIKFRDEVYYSKAKIKAIYYSFNDNYHLGNRLDATKEKLLRSLNHRVTQEAKADWVQELVENLSKDELQQMYSSADQEFDSSEDEYKFLAKQIVMQQLEKVHHRIIKNQFLNIRGQYINFLRQVPKLLNLADYDLTENQWSEQIEQVKADLRAEKISVADISAYLYLYDLMTGKHGDRDIHFVFIDEIQDYTPFQLAYLKFNFPKARFTMLGDLNQAIFTNSANQDLLAQTNRLFAKEKTKVVQLTHSYRSTAQITDFTKAILKNGQKIEAFDRQGPKPNIAIENSADTLQQRVIGQLEKNNRNQLSTAIITKTLAQSKALQAALKADGCEVTLIRSENQRLAAGDIVIPAYLAKGLEFDAVIAYDLSAVNYPDEDERQLIYTIASRAMHTLTIVAQKELTPLLTAVTPTLYRTENVTRQ